MGPLFSAMALGLLASVVLAAAFLILKLGGLSSRASVVLAAAFVVGGFIGFVAAALGLGIVMGFGKTLQSSPAIAAYLGILLVSALISGLFAARFARSRFT